MVLQLNTTEKFNKYLLNNKVILWFSLSLSEEIADDGTFKARFCSNSLFWRKQQKARKDVSEMFFSAKAGLDLRPHNSGETVQCCIPNAASWWLGNLRGRAPCGNKAAGFLFRPEMTCKTWPQERDRPL